MKRSRHGMHGCLAAGVLARGCCVGLHSSVSCTRGNPARLNTICALANPLTFHAAGGTAPRSSDQRSDRWSSRSNAAGRRAPSTELCIAAGAPSVEPAGAFACLAASPWQCATTGHRSCPGKPWYFILIQIGHPRSPHLTLPPAGPQQQPLCPGPISPLPASPGPFVTRASMPLCLVVHFGCRSIGGCTEPSPAPFKMCGVQ